MKPHLSASGRKVNWINYKTDVSHIQFKMHADNKQVQIGIFLSHKDDGIRELFYEQFLEFRSLFTSILEEEWHWENIAYDEYGASHSRIYTSTNGNIFDKQQWPDMFAFLKPRLIKLDEFWVDAVEIFKKL